MNPITSSDDPRTEVDFMDASFTVGKAIGLAIDKAHSRYPVVRGTITS